MRRSYAASVWVIALAIATGLPAATPAWAKDASAPVVEFLDGDPGRAAIVDESVEPYFSLLQPMEMATKTGKIVEGKDLAAKRDECRKRYRDAIQEFTAAEKDALTGLVAQVHAAWADEYPLFAKTPWSFLKVAGSIEGGLPHTRGKSIVFGDDVTSGIATAWHANPKAALAQFAGLFAHEQSHVVERLHPDVFLPLYTTAWGFVHAKEVARGAWLERRQVMNPDGIDVRWVFPVKEGSGTTYVQPFLVLSDGPEPRAMPNDFVELAVTLEKKGDAYRPREDAKGVPASRPLGQVHDYAAKFPGIGEIFHPNEIFACYFSAMVTRDHFKGPALPAEAIVVGKDFATLRAWCKEHFAVK